MRIDWMIRSALALFLLSASPVFAASFEPAWGRDGMVVSSVSPAVPVGQAVLERGGNAFDAAIAGAFAAAVAHPFSSGLGGGLFAVVYDAKSGTTITLDARETAPAGASAAFYRQQPEATRGGAYAVGVPGFVQAVWALHQRYGSLPWAELIAPAIDLAENGVAVSVWHRNIVSRVAPALEAFPETRRIQTLDGAPPPLGWMLKQPDLAKTLRRVQRDGEKSLAVGEMARRIAAATGGVLTELDLARYQVKWREPIRGTYRGYQLAAMPPPSSGGVLLVEMLNVLQRYDLAALGNGSSDYIHLVSSVMKLAFADRARYLGDPDFSDIPAERLISMEHADQLAARLRPDGQPLAPSDLSAPPDDAGTTHISVLDRDGNAVALTQSINTLFGSKITVPGTGIVLNNHMDDFSIDPATPNAWEAVGGAVNGVQAGKRPLSSMTPTLLFRDGRPVMAVGSPMGTMIISSVLQAVLNSIDFGLDASRAVNAPRFHHQWQPDTLFLEPEFPRDVRVRLQALGHVLADRPMIGAAELAVFDPGSCYFWGGADGRRDSAAAGANRGEPTALTDALRCASIGTDRAAAVPQ